MKNGFVCLFLSLAVVWFAEPMEPMEDLYIGKAVNNIPTLQVGLEISELMQNSFRNIGWNNFTCIIGQQFWFDHWSDFGWRILVLNVELAPEHLADPAAVAGLEGNRTDLSGSFFAVRLLYDWYTVLLKAWFMKVIPIFSTGMGLQRTIIKNPRYGQAEYDIKAIPLAVTGRIHVSLWHFIWIEMPFMEFSFNIWHNQPVKELGDLTVTRPDWLNIYGWITAGVTIPLH